MLLLREVSESSSDTLKAGHSAAERSGGRSAGIDKDERVWIMDDNLKNVSHSPTALTIICAIGR